MMGVLTAIILTLIAIALFFATNRGYITSQTLGTLANIAAVVALLGAILIFVIPAASPTQQNKPSPVVPPTATIQQNTPLPTAARNNRKLVQRIDFNYSDDPTNHNWILLDSTPVTFTHRADGYEGNVLSITSSGFYGMDVNVNQAARFGKEVEFLVMVSGDSPIYTRITIASRNGSTTKDAWLKLYPGSDQFRQIDDNEWVIYTRPNIKDGNWLLFQLNLTESVEKTFGKEGWTFQQLKGFRIRGDITIASISVFD